MFLKDDEYVIYDLNNLLYVVLNVCLRYLDFCWIDGWRLVEWFIDVGFVLFFMNIEYI